MAQSQTEQVPDPRRDAIVRNARRHFIAEGYSGTRMEPIAREAGVSTATLYAYFESKGVLFSAVIATASDDFAARMQDVGFSKGSPRDRLSRFALAYAEFMSDPFVRSVFRLVMAERPRFRDVALNFFERGRSSFGTPLMGALKEMAASGEAHFEKSSWAAGQLMGMIEHPVFFIPMVTGEEFHAQRPVDQIAEDAVKTFLARYAV